MILTTISKADPLPHRVQWVFCIRNCLIFYQKHTPPITRAAKCGWSSSSLYWWHTVWKNILIEDPQWWCLVQMIFLPIIKSSLLTTNNQKGDLKYWINSSIQEVFKGPIISSVIHATSKKLIMGFYTPSRWTPFLYFFFSTIAIVQL